MCAEIRMRHRKADDDNELCERDPQDFRQDRYLELNQLDSFKTNIPAVLTYNLNHEPLPHQIAVY